ncbi:MAG: DUF3825 domain-containing protein [Clostridia bacterium]|nr:DUF3825 domain-containing protein [Clostridia bacterium]
MEELGLFDYAFCGTKDGYNNMLEYLAKIVEPENWSNEESSVGVLYKYVAGTFKQCYKQNKIIKTDDENYSCFNTGLLTPNGNDVVAIFEKNNKEDSLLLWRLQSFRDITERNFLNIFSKVPELATYTNNYEELYFKPDIQIVVSTDHILDDNWERIKEVIPLDKSVVKTLLIGVVEETKKKIKRNMRLVVPQFYNNQIMYLMPIEIPVSDNKKETMALAVELTSTNQYRANTIFTKSMAYEKARLLMKPESNWLI